jgi:hypothetical protein
MSVGSPPPTSASPSALSGKKGRHTASAYSFIPDSIPARYRHQFISELDELEAWASLNAADARRDSLQFWLLKIPAILASACAGLFGYFNLQAATIITGAIGSICILIDGLNPRGSLRNVHIRAVHDLRQLQSEIKAKLRYASPAKDSLEEILASISELVQSERRRIGNYLREAESALGEAKQ